MPGWSLPEVPFSEHWLRARRESLVRRVETLKKGDRFLDCYGVELRYERIDAGAGPGATHHATNLGNGGTRYLAGWCWVLVLEPCPNHPSVIGLPWAACPVCENST